MSTKTDIQSLQNLIVGALEDVKGKDISVFDTEHLSALFERVIIVSGSSNRQTKALATHVRDEVRDAGLPKPRVEGETNGEWIIVDCGAAVVHVMQPIIREYYRLEEIWGDKPVKLKQAKARGLVKASEPMANDKPVAKAQAARKPGKAKPAVKTPTKSAAKPAATPGTKAGVKAVAKAGVKAGAKAAPTKNTAAKKAAPKKPTVKTAAKPVAAKKVVAKKATVSPVSKPKTITVNKPKPAAKKVVAKKAPAKAVVKPRAKPAAKVAAKPVAKKAAVKKAK
jgi:ribosome-associated protein